jgi:hypothetical protein
MRILSVCIAALVISPLPSYGTAVSVNLGTASTFAVLGATTVTNTGLSIITGDLGVAPGTAITGFPPGSLIGIEYAGGSVAAQAQADLNTAYNFAASTVDEPSCNVLTGVNLGGMTLAPGVYCFSSSALLSAGTGILTLDAQGNSNAVFVFQIGSTLTTGSGSSVDLINNAQGANIFWQVGSSATLGIGTAFEGNILADSSITLNTNATIGGVSPGECGSALALIGAVTMDTNTVSVCQASGVPEPSTAYLLLLVGVPALLCLRLSPRRMVWRLAPSSTGPPRRFGRTARSRILVALLFGGQGIEERNNGTSAECAERRRCNGKDGAPGRSRVS